MSEPTSAPAPTALSKLTDDELEQEFAQDVKKLSREQRSELYCLMRALNSKKREVDDE